LSTGPKAEQRKLFLVIVELDKILARLVKIDCMFRAAGIEFFPTDGIPSYFSKMTYDDVINKKSIPIFIMYRKRRMQDLGMLNYQDFRRVFNLTTTKFGGLATRGLRDAPGKSILKIIADLLNKSGKRHQNWTGTHYNKLLNDLLVIFQGVAGKLYCKSLQSGRALSWATARPFFNAV
jgi:hypothetical protein